MDIQNKMREVSGHITDAETCLGECSEDRPEYAVLQRTIKTLQLIMDLLKSMAELIAKVGGK